MKERRNPDMFASEVGRDGPQATRRPISPMFLLLMLLACLLISAIPPATASGEGMTIKGTLLEEGTDEPVVNASVTLAYRSNGTVVATTTTDEDGRYSFEDVPECYCLKEVTAFGADHLPETQEVGVDGKTVVNFALQSLPGKRSVPTVAGGEDGGTLGVAVGAVVALVAVLSLMAMLAIANLPNRRD